MLKRLLQIAILLCPIWAQATVTITANVKDVSATAVISRMYMTLELKNCGGNIAKVSGTSVVVPQLLKVTPDSSGLMSKVIFSNGQITCGTIVGRTYYRVHMYYDGSEISANNYLFNASCDLATTCVPIDGVPVIPPPTGDTTYARLDGGNQPFTGALSVPTSITGTTTPFSIKAQAATPCTGFCPPTDGGDLRLEGGAPDNGGLYGSVYTYNTPAFLPYTDNATTMGSIVKRWSNTYSYKLHLKNIATPSSAFTGDIVLYGKTGLKTLCSKDDAGVETCYATAGSGGSVTSVGLSAASDFVVSGSPVTTTGTLAFDWVTAPASANTASAIVKRDISGNFSAGTITASLTGNVTGNASTATALAANGTNCTSGNYPLGIDASGNVETCTAVALPWNSISNPTGNLSLTMGAFTSTFTYNNATGSAIDMFSFADGATNTGTGYLMDFLSNVSAGGIKVRIANMTNHPPGLTVCKKAASGIGCHASGPQMDLSVGDICSAACSYIKTLNGGFTILVGGTAANNTVLLANGTSTPGQVWLQSNYTPASAASTEAALQIKNVPTINDTYKLISFQQNGSENLYISPNSMGGTGNYFAIVQGMTAASPWATGTYLLTEGSTGVRDAPSSTTNKILGICYAECTTSTSFVRVAIAGTAKCTFDGAATAGNYVQASSTAGKCHDAGSSCPTSGWIAGQVRDTIGGAGDAAVTIHITPPCASVTAATTFSVLSGSATLDFANLAAIGCENLTMTVTGAVDGDPVALGVPNGSTVTNGDFTAWVSGADTVTVKFCTVVSGDPASGTFKAKVFH